MGFLLSGRELTITNCTSSPENVTVAQILNFSSVTQEGLNQVTSLRIIGRFGSIDLGCFNKNIVDVNIESLNNIDTISKFVYNSGIVFTIDTVTIGILQRLEELNRVIQTTHVEAYQRQNDINKYVLASMNDTSYHPAQFSIERINHINQETNRYVDTYLDTYWIEKYEFTYLRGNLVFEIKNTGVLMNLLNNIPKNASSIKINHFRTSVFNGTKEARFDHLTYLNLSNNTIRETPKLYCPSLEELDLSGNYIGHLQFENFLCPKLRILKCSRNQIARISFGENLQKRTDLILLDLCNNNLTDNMGHIELDYFIALFEQDPTSNVTINLIGNKFTKWYMCSLIGELPGKFNIKYDAVNEFLDENYEEADDYLMYSGHSGKKMGINSNEDSGNENIYHDKRFNDSMGSDDDSFPRFSESTSTSPSDSCEGERYTNEDDTKTISTSKWNKLNDVSTTHLFKDQPQNINLGYTKDEFGNIQYIAPIGGQYGIETGTHQHTYSQTHMDVDPNFNGGGSSRIIEDVDVYGTNLGNMEKPFSSHHKRVRQSINGNRKRYFDKSGLEFDNNITLDHVDKYPEHNNSFKSNRHRNDYAYANSRVKNEYAYANSRVKNEHRYADDKFKSDYGYNYNYFNEKYESVDVNLMNFLINQHEKDATYLTPEIKNIVIL